MARVEAGKLHRTRSRFRSASCWLRFFPNWRALASGRFDAVAEGLPAALADPDLIRQAIKQLVENAANYSPPGSPSAHGGGEGCENLDQGCGSRPWYSGERAHPDFRQVLSRQAAPLRDQGHRHGFRHCQRDCGSARRAHLGGERAGSGGGVFVHPAGIAEVRQP